jgi:ribosome biogenesis protein Nip4
LEQLIFYTHTYTSGLFLGSIKLKKFYPSFPFLYFVSKFGINYPYILLNDKAEILFLYGRDVLGDSIIGFSSELKENCLVIILNKNKEPLGIGRTRFSDNTINEKGKITVSNLMDLGVYHRNENKRDQSSLDLSYFLD